MMERLTGAAFAQLFTSFTRDAFRLETLDHYSVYDEMERFQRFLAGDPPFSREESQRLRPWLGEVEAITAAGKRMHRVHVVCEPLSDYLRFELTWGYPHNAEAGEEIFILRVGPDSWPDLPRHDFWLFDGETVARMHYDSEGHFLGAELIDDSEAVAQYCHWRDVALASANPLEEYLDRYLPIR